jgi:hypothetical protein
MSALPTPRSTAAAKAAAPATEASAGTTLARASPATEPTEAGAKARLSTTPTPCRAQNCPEQGHAADQCYPECNQGTDESNGKCPGHHPRQQANNTARHESAGKPAQ